MVAIIDYGVGNLYSLKSSLAMIGAEVIVTSDPKAIQKADRIILPGVGAFSDAAKKLTDSGLDKIIHEEVNKGKPLLGICLGMQLLFDRSFEYGEHPGLGLIQGDVMPIKDFVSSNLKIPHMGWNSLTFGKVKHPLFKYIDEGDYVYYVHSFFATNCKENIIASSEYGTTITGAVAKGNILGCQFHPEKSGDVGLNILKSFCEMETKA